MFNNNLFQQDEQYSLGYILKSNYEKYHNENQNYINNKTENLLRQIENIIDANNDFLIENAKRGHDKFCIIEDKYKYEDVRERVVLENVIDKLNTNYDSYLSYYLDTKIINGINDKEVVYNINMMIIK